jgi:hypothetical protein
VCCGLVAAIPALILGSSAKKEIAASGGLQSGEGMAQAGFILGIVGTILNVLVLIVVLSLIASGNLEPSGTTGTGRY